MNGNVVTLLRDVTTEIQDREGPTLLWLMQTSRAMPSTVEGLQQLRLETSRIAWNAGIGSQLASVADQLQMRVDEKLEALTRPRPIRVK